MIFSYSIETTNSLFLVCIRNGYFRRTNVMKRGDALSVSMYSVSVPSITVTKLLFKPWIIVGVGTGVYICIVVA